jgi:hypothetical protein
MHCRTIASALALWYPGSRQRNGAAAEALRESLSIYVVFFATIGGGLSPRCRAVAPETRLSRVPRLLQEPERRRLHLPLRAFH